MSEPSRMKVILLTDHGLLRAGLVRLLALELDFDIVPCDTFAGALEVLSGSSVDVVLLDSDVGTEHGSDFITAVRQTNYLGRILVISSSADVWNSAVALKLGASGVFLKSDAADHLIQAVRLVGSGGMWVDQEVIQELADRLLNRYSAPEDQIFRSPLEERERAVLSGILSGFTNRKIGDDLGLTESNVKNVVQRLFVKAGVKTRGQLVRVAIEGPSHDGSNNPWRPDQTRKSRGILKPDGPQNSFAESRHSPR